jgi:alpha-L-arabinofuranosidase
LNAVVCAQDRLAITVQTDEPGAHISPTMWGVFFEDINFGADGGLYAELVKNRSFEFPDPLMGWTTVSQAGASGTVEVRDADPFNQASPHYIRVRVVNAGAGFGVANEDFRGMGIHKGADYRFSTEVRVVEGGPVKLRLELVGQDGRSLATGVLGGLGGSWRRQTAMLHAEATDAKAHLKVLVESHGTVDLDMISLFPKDTSKHRPNGLRADLVQMLADLKPGFLLFPGGCIVEGRRLPLRYQWKTTLGAPEDRKLIINRWNDEFKHRPTPDYYQSFGLGFFEFFQLCEDIGAEPLPILNCGMACQFNSGELAPLDQLAPYIQDALDLIEFANGPATSQWGARRAAMGHPQPFHLKMLGVGNEQWGPQYFERYERFAGSLKAQYPEIKLISGAGPNPAGARFALAWSRLRELKADIVDEHCYNLPEWFLNNADRYDRYPRTGPKVFMGEYAAQSVKTVSPENRNNWECALAEAAYMTGLERNADVVVMASYAPLFAQVDAWQWTPDLIWFDNLWVYGTPSYYVQQLFSLNRGDVVLPTQITGTPFTADRRPRFYATASRDRSSGDIILKMVNATTVSQAASVNLAGTLRINSTAKVIQFGAQHLTDENSFDRPLLVSPSTKAVKLPGPRLDYVISGSSLAVFRIKLTSSRTLSLVKPI